MQATYKMLEYDRINISEGTDINETSASKECDICHYWYFKEIGFKYEPYLCNSCHDLTQKAMSFNDVVSKNDAVSIMNNPNLVDRKSVL